METLVTHATRRLEAFPRAEERYGLATFLRSPFPDVQPLLKTTENNASRPSVWEEATLSRVAEPLHHLLVNRLEQETLLARHFLFPHTALHTNIAPGAQSIIVLPRSTTPSVQTFSLHIGKGAHLTLTDAGEEHSLSSGYGSTLVLLILEEGAHVTWETTHVHVSSPHFVQTIASLGKGSTLSSASALLCNTKRREDTTIELREEGSTYTLHQLIAGTENSLHDMSLSVLHEAPHTTSTMQTNIIAGGRAQVIVRGQVDVAPLAPKTNGHQRVDSLLLSEAADVHAVPTLNIRTDDVRCTHGATTGHLNADQLFYLQSRGLSKERATELLVEGFAAKSLQAFSESRRGFLADRLHAVLHEHSL